MTTFFQNSCSIALALPLLLLAQNARAADDTPMGSEPSSEEEISPARAEGKRNTGLMVAGIVSASVGGLGLLVGGMSFALADARNTQVCENGSCHQATESDRAHMRTLGWAGVVSGVVLLGVGIPLIVIGAKRHPVQREQSAELKLLAAPGGCSLALTF